MSVFNQGCDLPNLSSPLVLCALAIALHQRHYTTPVECVPTLLKKKFFRLHRARQTYAVASEQVMGFVGVALEGGLGGREG